jgi:alpha-mannosidase
MPPSTVHIVTHTHWDREWFLTSVYTSRWLPGLIDKLEQLVALNPDFKFLFDGQTLVIEDLLRVAPDYAEKVNKLVSGGPEHNSRNPDKGNLIIGPYYSQPDWQLSGGELLIRNLMYGQQDVEKYGGATDTGWLVDTFGHISQSPQIHNLFRIDSVFVWRGVPELVPYFIWEGPDGSRLLTIYLFGGYRNLYGVSQAPEVAVRRLLAEVNKLQPFYPTLDVPLFDGYDLEDDPEDPIRFYSGSEGIGPDVMLQGSTPALFARAIRQKQLPLPVLTSELNSGKYGATFPGTLSSRIYLKIMAHDCEHLLYQVCEPLAVLARLKGREYNAPQYEAWGRILLQNAIHDAICGVSIDQVHEKMEYSYRQVFDAMSLDIQTSLGVILEDFAPGDYSLSTNPFSTDQWQAIGGEFIHVKTDGVGVWAVGEREPVEMVDQEVDSFTWRNNHYEATIDTDGLVRIGAATLGSLVISREQGDVYSEEMGESLAVMSPITPLTILLKSSLHCVLGFTCEWRAGEERVSASVRLQFDPSPLLKWEIALDSRGSDLRVEMIIKTAIAGERFAGMPFDLVRRPVSDKELLPRQLEDELSSVLLGQRELGEVSTFPFQNFVAVSDGDTTASIFTKGLHAYSADEEGTVNLTLLRALEWLTKADLKNRVGDAGPFFYVPDARCERTVSHVIAVAIGRYPAETMMLQALNSDFQNPPLFVRGQGSGAQTTWGVFHEEIPISSLVLQDRFVLARVYNPTPGLQPLSRTYLQTNVWGEPVAKVDAVRPRQIMTIQLRKQLPELSRSAAKVECFTMPKWRVGRNAGSPDPEILALLEEKVAKLEAQIAETEALLANERGTKRFKLQHHYYVLKRECVELRFSHLLNQHKLKARGLQSEEYLYRVEDDIAALGLELNRLRIKRRIFDYVVQAL